MNSNGVMIVAPSDHWIEDEEAFAANVTACFEKCEKEDVLCTLGIKPTFPNTGFGYIEFDKSDEEVNDGMDIVICSITEDKIQYAGAHNPLFYVDSKKNEVIEIKPNKQPIGKFDKSNLYDTHELMR